jgi:crossover junction endodeoxyribonuclease RusA
MSWVSLPYPPSANRMWRHIRIKGANRTVLSAEYKAWLETATQLVAMVPKAERVAGPYTLRIDAGRPDRRRRDVDNLIKPTSDAIVNGGLVEDDSLCQHVSAGWQPGLEGLRVLVLPTKERT